MFSPQLVFSYLSEEIGPCDVSRKPTRMEQTRILREALYDNLAIDCEEDEVIEDYEADPTWPLNCSGKF
ncbi:unnamed protein product [Cylicocyclus nassatus]|uniref:Uncharacterized protein n=1 Tax=Cylicocyclus nassatus TaxID=53992 RepID=A0AA36HAF6_CYLNA|nr:unnamed protein product [Cylicocyclus nassatus]